MESCEMSTIKYLLFSFNLIFAISGIGIITAGALILGDVGEFSHFLEGRILGPPIILIVAGAIVFFIAFLGCYGAIKENYTLLMAFAGALVLIFVVEFGVGITAALFKNDFANVLKDEMKNSLRNYSTADRMAWETVQMKLRCCGVDDSDDWSQATTSNYTKAQLLPPSCCRDLNSDGRCPKYDRSIYMTGCYAALEKKVAQAATILICVGIGIASIEIAGIVLACCLATSIKKEGGEG